jgi:hypothetical protein
MTHTPGPWRLQPIHLRGSTAYNIEPDIARIPSGLQPQSETDANARLLVAASELYEALRGLLNDYVLLSVQCDKPYLTDTVNPRKARAALAKAEGRKL